MSDKGRSPATTPPPEGSPATRKSSPANDQVPPASTTDDLIEVDRNLDDDNDSALGDSVSTYTSSLASSVIDYPIEHGRQYHAYRAGTYSRPNDDAEMERLLLLHEIMTRTIGGLYLAPIDKEKTHRILDIGTGTGIWAISIGDELPHAEVIGNDLSANMPTFVPPNVKFEVDDVESPWLHDAKFDWIFCRYMAAGIFDWPKLVSNIYDNLNPLGWAEFQDFDLQYYSDDGSLAPDDPLLFWISTLLDAARSLKRDPNPGSQLEGWVRGAGFVNVEHKRYKIPIGPWARDPALKEIGLWNYWQVNGGLEGLTLRLFTGVLGWKEDEILVLLAKVRQSLRNPAVHAMFDFHVVYGQRPGV
ncbi:methyltransferase domain-containing protein [Cercophora scortea]|uniref:Methyltransferase domain-containing protein n=1 Tax=Cercophora scortea TaxID=314031 RepID=A0AAE0MIU5_9PEZI|nr:methyltransferase domain-containing protein [Cercophora scortea]